MQIDIPAHIEKLLFLHDTLAIPGFGGFTATRKAAEADLVGGVVNPPQKTLAFSENLSTDDGILSGDIADTHHIPLEDARRALQDFVDKMNDLLNQREIVTLPGVGRLYKNYVQKIQFLPEATNFNTESFGLPPLQFSPIARSREVSDKTPNLTPTGSTNTPPATSTPPPPVHTPETPAYEAPKSSGSSALTIILGVALLAIGITAGIMWWRGKHKKPAEPAATEAVADAEKEVPIREEAHPAKTNTAPAPKTERAKTEEKSNDRAVQESVAKRMDEARNQIQNSGAGRECILVVATLQEKTNADRAAALLKNNGYQVYFVQNKGYQVGIQFRYQNLSEVQQKIIALQKLTGEEQIWIKKK